MIKNLLRILASSATFVAVMLITNTAIAQPGIDISSAQMDRVSASQAGSSFINLSQISSSLKPYKSDNPLLDHLGCSCAVCTQGVTPGSSNV